MFYASNYYASNYYKSLYYRDTGAVPSTGRYYDRLGDLGFVGTINDRQYAYLKSLGFTGAHNDCMKQHLEALGYVGSMNAKLQQKAQAEGNTSVNDMLHKQGLIPAQRRITIAIEHNVIPDAGLHELKGGAAAAVGDVPTKTSGGVVWQPPEFAGIAAEPVGKIFVSDGAGGGAWQYLAHGWAYYQDAATSPATLTLTTTPQVLQIDGAGAFSDSASLPREIRGSSELWDTATDTFTPMTLRDSYLIRMDLDITADTGTPTFIEAEFDIGGDVTPTNVIVDRIVGIAKSPPYQVSITLSVFVKETFLANGMQIFLCTDSGTITVAGRAISIYRVSAGDQ